MTSLIKPQQKPQETARATEPDVERVHRELSTRANPERVVAERRAAWPWSRESRTRAAAEEAALAARLQVFLADLRAVKTDGDVLNRAATLRAIEAAELAVFEVRTAGESARMAVLTRAQLAMADQFARHLEAIDGFRGRLPDEIIDALKQRALADFTDRMNRLAGADLSFTKDDLLRLEP